MKRGVRFGAVLLLLALQTHLFSQTSTDQKAWFLKNPEADQLQGVSAEKAYKILNNKPSKTVLVAVVDSGIDIDHEDLKSIIWVNTDEVAGNGKDDDNNGYVDDVNGWSYLGNTDGENINGETLEVTREYKRLKPKFGKLRADKVKKKDKAEFEYWLTVSEAFKNDSAQARQQYDQYAGFYQNLKFCNDTLKSLMEVDLITEEKLRAFEISNPQLSMAKTLLLNIFTNVGSEANLNDMIDELGNAVEHFESQVNFGYNTDYDSRAIVKDDPKNLKEIGYGNNDVEGPDASHGTHVAGIIGAVRGNGIGIDGIANNVRIMPVRAVPNGDERDKDIANAIRYAVDNGAQIINMSFGKAFSPDKALVDEAMQYAQSKGVLLIHAAGNDGKDTDVENNFPNRFITKDKSEINTWIEVGAISSENNDDFIASFSNYGKKSVHLFAPGVDIYSTIPNNGYKSNNGTSMAAPAVTGVAALVMSFYPDLTAAQVREILLKSSRKYDKLEFVKPGSEEMTKLQDVSVTGGVIDAYNAVLLAEEYSKKN